MRSQLRRFSNQGSGKGQSLVRVLELREVKMTRKDYIKIAEILRDGQAPDHLIDSFAQMLWADNPQFNHGQFENACKEEGKS